MLRIAVFLNEYEAIQASLIWLLNLDYWLDPWGVEDLTEFEKPVRVG
jgi:hypothetical protein